MIVVVIAIEEEEGRESKINALMSGLVYLHSFFQVRQCKAQHCKVFISAAL